MNESKRVGRRGFLAGAGAALGLAGASTLVPLRQLLAAPLPERRFVALAFDGGWDVLLGPDARDPSVRYGSALNLGTELLAPQFRDPIPVRVGDREVLWGAPMRELMRHADVLTVFRGVNMNTGDHFAGMAYGLTFLTPVGGSAVGDSLTTRMSSGSRWDDLVVPSISVRRPSRNLSFGSDLTGLDLARLSEITDLLGPLGPSLDTEVEALLAQAAEESRSCLGASYSGPRPDVRISEARERVARLFDRNLVAEFDLSRKPELLRQYGISNPRADDPPVRAALVRQLLATGVSRTVFAPLVVSLDTHFDNWATQQPTNLKLGFDTLARLLDDLRSTDPDLDHTTVLVHSEFARTPRINGNGGRDHWPANSFLVFGGGLEPGVFGETVEGTLNFQPVDLVTGRPSERGEVLRPEHVGATLAAAAGIDPTPFRSVVLDAWIRGGRS